MFRFSRSWKIISQQSDFAFIEKAIAGKAKVGKEIYYSPVDLLNEELYLATAKVSQSCTDTKLTVEEETDAVIDGQLPRTCFHAASGVATVCRR